MGLRPVRRTSVLGGAAALALAAAGAARAEGPLSAIDWLTRSVAAPPAAAAPLPPSGAPVDTVTVRPLDALARDAAGTLDPAEAGLPRGLWGAAPAEEVMALIAAERLDAVPALRALFEAMLLARLDPPADVPEGGRFLLARIDKLLDMGGLAPALALIDAAGGDTAELFRRRFDIALLLDTEDEACAALRAAPGIAPTYPVRIFCLARGGDWQAATLTLDTARALGAIPAEEEALLARFLDLEAAEDHPPLTPPDRPTPLALRLFEAIGEPIPTAGLPLAFAHADLRLTVGWKGRLEAAERLARAGALPHEALMALYAERRPAASGGVWERVRAVQALTAALERGGGVGPALLDAWTAMQAAELELPFALGMAAPVSAAAPDGPAASVAFRMALLAGLLPPAPPPGDAEARFLAALAQGAAPEGMAPETLGRAIAPAFGPAPGALVPPRLAALIAADRRGEAVLQAMTLIAEGSAGDRRRVTEGLAALRTLGLEAAARETALQLLLLDRRG